MTHRHKKFIGIAFMVVGLLGIVLSPHAADAQRLFPTILPSCDQDLANVNGFHTIPEENRCTLNDFVKLFINLFDWGLAVLSILSVAFFIIGGTILLLSGGSEQRISSGKSILTNTTLGLGIALGSWLIINTVIGLLVGNGTFQDVRVFGSNWWGVATCASTYNKVCSQNNLGIGCGDISSNYVSQLQRALNDAPGCLPVEADGCFGPQTEQALEVFNRAQNPEITPNEIASFDTWQALNEGKGCQATINNNEPATAVPPQVGGCCVPQCESGFPNTVETNGLDGCKEIFPGAVWSTESGSACADDRTRNTSGCCITLSGTCYDDANSYWCTSQLDGGGKGAYYNLDCSNVWQCSAERTLSCTQ